MYKMKIKLYIDGKKNQIYEFTKLKKIEKLKIDDLYFKGTLSLVDRLKNVEPCSLVSINVRITTDHVLLYKIDNIETVKNFISKGAYAHNDLTGTIVKYYTEHRRESK